MRSIRSEQRGVNSLGLIIARLPAAKIPASGVNVRLNGKFHGLMTPTVPFGWYSMKARAPNRPSSAGSTLRFSRFIHVLRWALACFSGPIEPETSVNIEASGERLPKSSRKASVISSLCATSKPMARSSHSMRFSARTGPSFI